MKDLKKFIATTIREYLNENFKSFISYNDNTIIKKFNDKYELDNTIKYFPNHPNLFPILDKYQKLINDIMKIVGKYFLLDVHSLNFGYDKNGNLKMFDI